MNYKIVGITVAGLAILGGGYFLLKGGYQAPTPGFTPLPTQEVSPTGEQPSLPQSEVKEFTIVGDEYRFQPSSITLKSGERVKITFKNNGRAVHNLIIEKLEIETKTLGTGQTDTIEFITPTTGSYTFSCSIPGHKAAGMEGNLTVK